MLSHFHTPGGGGKAVNDVQTRGKDAGEKIHEA